ncbi:hypothetical protein D3C83_102210 [compost metagenome]
MSTASASEISRNALASSFLKYVANLSVPQTTKCTLKLMPPASMNTIATASMAGLSKKAILASCVEYPPVDRVEKACPMASKASMPASQ